MSFYPAVPPLVTLSAGEDAAAESLGLGGMVAVRLADLVSPARAGLGKDGRSALVAAGAGKIRKGDVVVFCKPVTGGCRRRGTPLITPGWARRRNGWTRCAGSPA